MSQYEHLPIYRKAMDLAVYIENVVRGFSKYHKYTLGTDLRNLSRAVVRLIIRANSERDRLATLSTLRDTIEELKVCMRICKEDDPRSTVFRCGLNKSMREGFWRKRYPS